MIRTSHLTRFGAVAAVVASMALVAGCDNTPAPPPMATTQLMAVNTPPPGYPEELACNEIGGQVVLQLTVGPEGTPTTVKITQSSGVPALDKSATEAVRSWQFEPATRGGNPVASQLSVPVTFTPPTLRPDSCFALDEQRRTQAAATTPTETTPDTGTEVETPAQ